jgi:REP element-mobilizing transposase RayT
LEAVAVRSNHVHLVVGAQQAPERVMNAFKSWATRALTGAGALERGAKVWARHGSTRYLWQSDAVSEACRYVLEQQGGERFSGE